MRTLSYLSLRAMTCVVFVALFSFAAFAQFKAGVQGTVTDSTGATVAGATVTLTNTETNQSQTATTSDEGTYRFASLAPGIYTVTVEQQGFKKRVVENVKVDAEVVRGQDISLEAGVISETVTVTSDNEVVQTEDANIRKTITNDEILKLPQVGRDPYELARLTPGVFGAGARSSSGASSMLPNTSGPGGSNVSIFQTENAQPISANGQRVSSNNYEVDGTSVNSQTWGGAAVITPSQESVKEVQVSSSTYSAEDGRNSGAQVKVVTQNGTNKFHGSAFFKMNEPDFNAANTMPAKIGNIVTEGPQKVMDNYKSYGGSFGGPIIKNKAFFFFSYEGLRNNTTNVSGPTFIDTSSLRAQILSARPGTVTAHVLSIAGLEPRVAQVLNASDQVTGVDSCRDIFVPCRIVGNGIDIGSITGSYGTYIPGNPANGGGFDGIADLQYVRLLLPSSFKGHQYFTRLDFDVTDNDKIAVSTFFTPVTATTSNAASQSRPDADITSKRLNYAVGIIYNRVVSASTLNELRFNVTRFGYNELDSNPDARFDVPRVEIEGIWSDRLRYGPPQGQNTPGTFDEKQFDLRDTLSWLSGNHSVKFGGEFRHDQNRNGETGGARPLYSFVRPWNFANGTPVFEAVAATADGKPSPNNSRFFTRDVAAFMQDDWKFRRNLTLNIGVRWEYFSPISVNGGGSLGNLILDSSGGLAGAHIDTSRTLSDSDWNNFAPQLGFAWSPKMFKDKMVLRGGGGIGYDRLPNALLANARRNPPNGALYSFCCGFDTSPFVGGLISFVDSTDGTIFGYPANPNVGQGTNPANGLPNSGTVEIYGTPRDLPNAEVYRYSLDAQYELPWKLVADLGYQGSAGRHFVRIDPVHITGSSLNGSISAAYFARPDVNTNYNAFLANLNSRMRYGLDLNVNYRFAKSLDTTSFEGPCGCTNQSYPLDQKEEHGPSDFDVRHYIVGSAVWDVPFFNKSGNWTKKLLAGWQISSIFTHHTGFPWTPRLFAGLQGATPSVAGFGDIRPTAFFGTQPLSNTNANFLQPGGIFPNNLIAGADCNTGAGCSRYFLTVVNGGGDPRLNRPGIGRNTFRGPQYSSLDMSFVKKIPLAGLGFFGDASSFDIRVNFFNITNKLNLAPFNAATDSTRPQLDRLGVALAGLAGRTGELQLRLSF
jgi:hypothetical protein